MDVSFWFNTKPVRAMIALSEENKVWYASMLAKEIDCAYAHLVNLLDELAKNNLVGFEKEGRVKVVKLTPAGKELAHDLKTVVMRINKLASKSE